MNENVPTEETKEVTKTTEPQITTTLVANEIKPEEPSEPQSSDDDSFRSKLPKIIGVLLFLALLAGAGIYLAKQESIVQPSPSATPIPTEVPTVVPTATATPIPTLTPKPKTPTPVPQTPTPVPLPKPVCTTPDVQPESSGQAPLNVSLYVGQSSSTPPADMIQWDFNGDGNWDIDTSFGSSSDYTYQIPGTYTLKVQIRGNNGAWSDTCQTTVTVN